MNEMFVTSQWQIPAAGVITCTALLLPLTVWTLGYQKTDVAALSLLPIIVILAWSNFQLSAATNKSYLQIALLESSKFRNLLTGRISAIVGAVVFSIATGVLLGLNALTLSLSEVQAYLGLLVTGVFISSLLTSWTQSQFKSPYSHTFSVNVSTVLLSLLYIPVVVWVNWHFVQYPGMIKTATLSEVIDYSSSQLPSRRTWLVELVAIFEAFAMIKVWLVVKLDSPTWARILFTFDTAVASVLLARGISVINVYTLRILRESVVRGSREAASGGSVNDARS